MHAVGFGLGILYAWLVIVIIGFIATALCVRWFWKRRRAHTRVARIAAAFTAASASLGAGSMFVGLIRAFGAIGGESVDPSQKARLLAESIAEAMNGMVLATFTWLPSVILLVALTSRERKRRGSRLD